MFTMTWARGIAAASLLATLALPALASPVLVDFEQFQPDFVLLNDGETYAQSDFNVTVAGAGAVVDINFCNPLAGEFCPTGNSTSVLTALNDTTIDLTHASRVFGLGSFSAAFVPSPQVDLFTGVPIKLVLDGISASGAAVSKSVDLVEDGSNPGSFLFGVYDASELGALRSLQFSLCFDDGLACGASPFLNDASFALDDLSLSVPEPGAAWLVALSLAGLALTRRRAR